jgi:hypothetical protein
MEMGFELEKELNVKVSSLKSLQVGVGKVK